MPLLEISNLRKSFRTLDGASAEVLNVSFFCLEHREQVALSGESGSGKTTFLNLIAGIMLPDQGRIFLGETEITGLTESARDRVRATQLGYVFQTFNLLQGYTCLENVLFAMSLGRGVDRAFAVALLERVGLKDRLRYYPRQLSTGQQQRVAVARALANHPRLVLADEPTGNLDSRNAREVLAMLREVCAENAAALLLVSHDQEVLMSFESARSLDELNAVHREGG